jgi:hypothetical protein
VDLLHKTIQILACEAQAEVRWVVDAVHLGTQELLAQAPFGGGGGLHCC